MIRMLLIPLSLLIGCDYLLADDDPISYSKDIRPIFVANCVACHQAAKDESDYVMTDFDRLLAGGESGAPAIVPGDPDASYLVELITPVDGEAEMPLTGMALSNEDVDLIRKWIQLGAKNDYLGNSSSYSNDNPPIYRLRPNVTALDVSPDGRWLAVNGLHEIFIVPTEAIDLQQTSVQFVPGHRRLIGLSPRIESLAFSPDGKRLAATGGIPGELGEIQIWNVESGELEISKIVSNDTAYGASWSPDGKLVAFGLTDTTLRAIDAVTGEQVLYQSAHEDWIRDTVFSVDGSQLVSVGRDMTCKLNEVSTQRFIDNITSITPGVLKGGISSVVRHPTRDEIVIGGSDGIPKVYRMNRITKRVIGDDANLVRLLPAVKGRIQSVAVAADGKRIAAAGSLNGAGQVQVYSYEFDPAVSDQLKAVLAKQPTQWSPEERSLVEAYNSAGVKTISTHAIAESSVYTLSFAPDRNWIAAAGADGLIRLIDTETGERLATISPIKLDPSSESSTDFARLRFGAHELTPPNSSGQINDRTKVALEQGTVLRVFPESIRFQQPTEYVQLVIQAVAPDGTTTDVTHEATLNAAGVPIGIVGTLIQPDQQDRPGEGTLQVEFAGLTATIPVSVDLPETSRVPDFRRDVNPILTKLGCNAGTCHGSATGKMGFKLSLRGYDPVFDVRAFTDDMGARRTNLAAPAESLMLKKPTGTVPHVGGKLLGKDSKYYAIIHDWIKGGAQLDLNLPKVQSVELFPKNPILPAADFQQQVRVVATYSDGSTKDVTREAFVEIGDIEIANVDGSRVTALRRGETPLLARFEGAFTATTLTVMGDRSGFSWKPTETWGKIDELVAQKWKTMKIQPSELCSDAEFVRRVYLDLTGLPPSVEAVNAFLNDTRETRAKRDALIDELIGNSEFVEHWSNKWADLLQVNRKYLGTEGAAAFRDWLRNQVKINRPYNQLAYDILTASGSNRENPAAAYFKIHRTPEDAMENTTHLFLATRFNCNKCHDHPFERWTQDQYFETAAFFAQIDRKADPESGERKVGGTAVESAKPLFEIIADVQQGELTHERTGLSVDPEFPFDCDFESPADASRRQRLAAWITSADNPYFATSYVNRLWGYLLGTGLIEPLDDLRAGNPPSNPELLEFLRREFVAHDFDVQHVLGLICKSRTYQLSISTNPFNAEDTRNYSHAIARRLPAEVLFDSIHAVTGSQLKIPGVPPGTRAAALPDSGVKLPSGFLTTLGRPARESVCECERANDLQLGSVLALVSGPDLARALSDKSNAIQTLVETETNDRELVNQLYLRILNRPASAQEIDLAVASFGQIQTDHKRLVALRDQRQQVVTAERPQRQQQRDAALADAKHDLQQLIQQIDPQLSNREAEREQKIAAAQSALDEYRKLAPSFEDWKRQQVESSLWHTFLPDHMESEAGKELKQLADESILAEQRAGQDTYTLSGATGMTEITHLRLEMLPDEDLKGRGPGLAENGNLVLSEIFVETAEGTDPENWKPAKLGSAVANFEQQGFPINNAIDGKIDRSGWAINGTAGKESWATFEFESPIVIGDATRLRIRLVQKFDDRHQLGRFRISFSESHQSIGLGITQTLAAKIAAESTTPLTKADQEQLANAFDRSDPKFTELEANVKTASQPLTIAPEIIAAREKVARLSQPLPADAALARLNRDVAASETQLANQRLTAAQDLAWALINSPAFLFNR